MPEIVYSSEPHPGFILLSDEFILQHMPKANGTYVKVYLYAYQHYCNRTPSFSTAAIARDLGLIESDVIEAFHYWQEKGLLAYSTEDGRFAIRFEDGGSLPTPPPTQTRSRKEEPAAAVSKVVRVEHKPTYSPEELAVYQMNPKIARLFAKAASCLGAPLSPPNLSLLYSFYDYYRLPVDVIEFLMDYCMSNGGRSLRYMEKVAQDWSDQNIHSIEKAQAYVQRFTAYRPILNALHIRTPRPSDSDLVFINRWIDEYQMPIELIVEACERTYARTGQASFPYADSILENWSIQNIRTMEDVTRADESFARSHGIPSEKAGGSAGRDAFRTYTGHSEWDYNALEEQFYSERK